MPDPVDEPEIILLPNMRGGRNGGDPPFRTRNAMDDIPRPSSRRGWIIAAIVFGLFVLLHNGVPLYTDWLWFGEVGYRQVFNTTIVAKTGQFALCTVLFFLIFWINVKIARRLAPESGERLLFERFGPDWGGAIQRGITVGLLVIAVVASLFAGRYGADHWTQALEFLHAQPFHATDPVFQNDISFYVFRLPYLAFWQTFLMAALVITLAAVGVIHFFGGALESLAGLPHASRGVKTQLLVLGALIALMQAAGTRMGAFDLLNQENGVFTGAGYTDLRFRLLANTVQIVLLVVTAVFCFAAIRSDKALRGVGIGLGGWLASWLILGLVLPGIVEKTYVEPNQSSVERAYIERNIAATRQGFGLTNVRRVGFPADAGLNAQGVRANQDTFDNVRLWDHDYLSKIYAQQQTVKTYYKFEQASIGGGTSDNLDIDRYPIGGKMRQVMLAARELNSDALPASAQTWQNQRLSYTHGYGLVMSPVNQAVNGGPTYFAQGFPLSTAPEAADLKVTQPDIYYGQLVHDYVFVDTEQQEFDYPATSDASGAGSTGDHYTHYAGHGGIRIGDSPLAKLAFTVQLGDQNILLSKGFTARTRVLYRRDIRDRIHTIAPFVQQDGDPYLVVNPDDGRLVWIVDCYTLTDRYPYSTPQSLAVNPSVWIAPNYIRNSIKATVDAYDGTVNLFVADPNDPIAQTYAQIFPGLLKPMTQMASGLRAHLRYPEDLFRVQRSVYAAYHVDDPLVFYRKDDAWAIPNEPNGEAAPAADSPNPQSGLRPMEPYYVTMRLPAEGAGNQKPTTVKSGGAGPSAEEFLLMSPMAPISRENQNILGWMCARCDPEHYGELVLYQFPQSASVTGPSQVVAQINTDRDISAQLTLLRSGGSNAALGNMIVIPVERSLLSIVPLYIEPTGATTRLPQLQKVIVAYGPRVVMQNSLAEALASLFGSEAAPTPQPDNPPPNGTTPNAPTGPAPAVPTALRNLIQQAAGEYNAAQAKLKAGDFAGYGEATKKLQATLETMKRLSR